MIELARECIEHLHCAVAARYACNLVKVTCCNELVLWIILKTEHLTRAIAQAQLLLELEGALDRLVKPIDRVSPKREACLSCLSISII